MKRTLLFILILLFSLSDLASNEVQIGVSGVYNPTRISDWKGAGGVDVLFSGYSFTGGAGARYQKSIFSLSYFASYDFTKGDELKYLDGTTLRSRPVNPSYLSLEGAFEYIQHNGWENIVEIKAGTIWGGRDVDNRIGIALSLGGYLHISQTSGFRNVMYSLAPDASITIFMTFMKDFYLNLSFITAHPYFHPALVSYGWGLNAAYDISEYFYISLDGNIFFNDLMSETRVLIRKELSIMGTVRIPL